MKRLILLAVLPFLLTGCTELADTASRMAGMGVISEEKTLFDGARVVQVTPSWLFNSDTKSANNVKLGARWSSARPNFIDLVLLYESNTMSLGRPTYVGIVGIDINIDGRILSFKTTAPTQTDNSGYNSVSRTIYTESRGFVQIPMDVFNQMLDGKKVLLRIGTSKGFEDSNFLVERFHGGQGTALLSLREFRAKISDIRK